MPPRQLRLHTLRLSALPFFRSLLEGPEQGSPLRSHEPTDVKPQTPAQELIRTMVAVPKKKLDTKASGKTPSGARPRAHRIVGGPKRGRALPHVWLICQLK